MNYFPQRAIEPPSNFTASIMTSVRTVEKQRVKRVYAGFALMTVSPLALRGLWSVVRHDYFSLEHFPMGHILVKLYSYSMSGTAIAVFFVLGIAMANRIYLGAWLKVPLPISKAK